MLRVNLQVRTVTGSLGKGLYCQLVTLMLRVRVSYEPQINYLLIQPAHDVDGDRNGE